MKVQSLLLFTHKISTYVDCGNGSAIFSFCGLNRQ